MNKYVSIEQIGEVFNEAKQAMASFNKSAGKAKEAIVELNKKVEIARDSLRDTVTSI